VEGVFVPITANFGLNLYIGNNEAADGAYVLPRGVAFRPGDPADDFEGRRVAEQTEGRPLTSAELSAWWSARAWAFVRSEPWWAARLVVEKIRILGNAAEYAQLHDYNAYTEVAPVLAVLPTAGFVVVPGLAGLLTLLVSRERRPLAKRLAALTLGFAASFLPFFVVGRYRAPWLLLLVPFAVQWFGRVTAAWRKEQWRAVFAHVALVGVLTWFSSQAIAMPNASFQYMEFARASAAHGDREAAVHWCFRALAEEPGRADAAALLGRMRRDEGRYQEAERVLETALQTNPGAAAVWLELGIVRMDTQRYDAGVEALLSSVDADPRSVDAWNALAIALRAAGREDEAMAAESSAERLKSAASER
jgi:predicted negative regulator of RcsB-dependent stress response